MAQRKANNMSLDGAAVSNPQKQVGEFTCLGETCPFYQLADRHHLGRAYISPKFRREVIENCVEIQASLKNNPHVDVPCGMAGFIVDKATQGRRVVM